MHELKLPEFARITPLFAGHKQYLPVQAIVEKNFPGRVFVDDPIEPNFAVVWAVGRWAYLEGVGQRDGLGLSLAELLRGVIIPDSLRINMNWFELYTGNQVHLRSIVEDGLSEFDFARHFESVYVWDGHRYARFRSEYEFPAEGKVEVVRVPIARESVRKADFLAVAAKDRTAPGVRLTVDGRIVAQCRSNGFASGHEFMIDVETFDRCDRGRGYATVASVALLDYCLENGLAPLWETTEDNTASRRLAEKLGFVEHESYPVYAIEFEGL